MARTALLPYLDAEGGTRATEIAERAGMTKQVAGRVGYVGRRADPEDARATLVAFTDEGWRFLEDAHHVKRGIEAEYAAVLGEERMGLVRSALEELLEHE